MMLPPSCFTLGMVNSKKIHQYKVKSCSAIRCCEPLSLQNGCERWTVRNQSLLPQTLLVNLSSVFLEFLWGVMSPHSQFVHIFIQSSLVQMTNRLCWCGWRKTFCWEAPLFAKACDYANLSWCSILQDCKIEQEVVFHLLLLLRYRWGWRKVGSFSSEFL